MKAAQTFSILVDDEGNHVARGGKELFVKKGETVLDKYVHDLVQNNPEFLELKYVDGVALFSPEELVKFDLNKAAAAEKPKLAEEIKPEAKKQRRKRGEE
ncbi:hypothetical protein HY571_01830 [Candidatus Micrarchaeota archaeon]|nr:hypothetical protein [Candidatus Micrarchaeota archaeon]